MRALARDTPAPDVLVGRSADLARLRGAVASGARLVTLVGPGGVGKTRLALAYAAEVARAGGHARVCDLTVAHNTDELCAAAARALGVPADALRGEPAPQIGAWLRGRGPLVLVLDNVEQVARDAGRALAVWLAAAPEAVFVATSRQALRTFGETALVLEPLALPRDDTPGAIAASDAVALFVQRAAGAGCPIELATDGARVADLVRRLDGLPLAIELAAARLEVLSLAEVHARLGQRFELLRLPPGAQGPEADRHGALWRTIEWSWQLLAPAEQTALAQLAVFQGGFTLDAAEAVLALGAREGGALDVVHALVQRTLLRAARVPAGGASPRFFAYESVREFALSQPCGDRDATRARHAAHYLARGEAWAAQLTGPSALAALEHLAAERENLVAVLDHALAAPAPCAAEAAQRALRAALVLSALLDVRGPIALQLALLDRALAAAASHPELVGAALYLRALLARGRARRMRGEGAAGLVDLRAALAGAQAAGLRALEALAHGEVGAALGLDAYAARRAHYERALAIHRAEGDAREAGIALARLGMLMTQHGDAENAAEGCLAESLALLRAAGDQRFEAYALEYLGGWYLERGRLAAAKPLLERARALDVEFGSRLFEGSSRHKLAIIDHLEGRLDGLRERYGAAVAIFAELGHGWMIAVARTYLAALLAEQGALDAARGTVDAALAAMRDAGDWRYEGVLLALGAAIDALEGALDAAEGGLAQSAARLAPVAVPAEGAVVDAARAALDAARAARAGRAGDRTGAGAHLAQARARAAALAAVTVVDTRMVLRLAAQQVARAASDVDAWWVDARGAWFAPPARDRVELAHKPALVRLLAALVAQRRRAPGAALGPAALVAAGWPGERLARRVAGNRLHVALNALRRAGLRELLVHADGGYVIDPSADVRVAGVTSDDDDGGGATAGALCVRPG